MVTAWVLVILFIKSGITVSGIATQEDCEALGKQIVAEAGAEGVNMHPRCNPYRTRIANIGAH